MSHRLAELVDPARLARWLDVHLPGAGEQLRVTRITSGASNEIFQLDRGERRWVLRRPPLASDGRPDAMAREFRVLRALDHTAVPHPRALALCSDPDVIGATFYVMERIDGFTPRDPLPAPFADDSTARRGLGVGLIDVLGDLAGVDWRAVGLDDFGRPDGYLERQVDRWLGQLARVRTRELPGLDPVARWLRDHTPAMGPPGLLHGDYQLANVMFHHELPVRVAAVVDWEQSTIGDPLVDVGWLLALWDEPGEEPVRGPGETRVNQQTGFPSRHDLAEAYTCRAGRALDDLGWYEVLALFKLACVLEGGYARHARGASDNPAHARLEAMVPALVRSAACIVERGGRPR